MYSSDLVGRLTKWREGALGPNPTFPSPGNDPAGSVADAIDGEEWALDLLGNWSTHGTGAAIPVPTDALTANALNQFADVVQAGESQAKLFKFDWLGQLVQNDSKSHKYQWDGFGRLTRVITPGAVPAQDVVIATYRYDAFNRRVEKTTSLASDLTTRFLYDGWRAIEERALLGSPNQTEVVRARYGFGLDLDEVVWMDRDLNTGDSTIVDSRFFFSHDAMGSIVAATEDRINPTDPAPGNALVVRERYTYSAYGKLSIWNGSWSYSNKRYANQLSGSAIGMPYTYTGQRFDPESGLYFYKNRYFDPVMGRFLSRDPMGLRAGPNVYSYVSGQPHVWIDPLGLYQNESMRTVDRVARWNDQFVRAELARFNRMPRGSLYSMYVSETSNPDGTSVASVDMSWVQTNPQFVDCEGNLIASGDPLCQRA